MDRRDFFKASAVTAGMMWLGDFQQAYAKGSSSAQVGKKWKGWKKGQFQVHFIYTGVSESAFYIFPDGTTMLLDCGDHNAVERGAKAVPTLPNCKKHAGEWIARYVQRVNPNGNEVDYMMLSHYHNDHGGSHTFYASKDVRDGEEYRLSGFAHAGEFLHFSKGIDRLWPDFNDPMPLPEGHDGGVELQMRSFYKYHTTHRGLQMEKFRLGATDQIVPLRNPASCPDFQVFNMCGNGRICSQDGKITDLYAERIAKQHPKSLNENGMSLGMIITYGKFKMYTAGDFSDGWTLEDGTRFEVEDAIADVCPKVNVAKINHHGHYSMTEKLLKALQARVYVSCVWDTLHNVEPVMERIADRSLYPGERIICPGIFPPQRQVEDAGKPWLGTINEAALEGGHIVLTVEKGGEDYSITYLTADDESMRVNSVMTFKA